MASKTILYLSRRDVEAVAPSMPEIIAALEQMFREKAAGHVEMPPKPGIHTRENAFIHAMPAFIPALQAAGMKWVSGYPANPARQLPYISGLLILNDPDTGFPLCVMDATWVTAKRTAAATAIAAKHLARPDSSNAGIIACGVQGRSNLEALQHVFTLSRVKAFDINPEAAKRFRKDVQSEHGLDVQIVSHPVDAVRGLDIVVTSGPILKNPAPVIEPNWLEAGAFACALDFDSYWQGAALQQADKLATDDLAQMQFYRHAGYFQQTPEPYADLGEIVAGRKPGRETPHERIICVNLGLALEDMATAVLIFAAAEARGAGTRLPL